MDKSAFMLRALLLIFAFIGGVSSNSYAVEPSTNTFEEIVSMANKGNAEAQNNLGLMYDLGEGVPKDYKKAIKWYRKAAEQGYAMAQNNLGLMYFGGDGVSKNDAEAAKWLKKAAEQGYAEAQNNLGGMFCRTEDHKNCGEAVKWFSKAAEQGNPLAQSNLGGLYADGKGVPKDYAEGYKWFNLASAQNNSHAIKSRNMLEKLMTPEQIAEGQRLSREWTIKNEAKQ